MKNKNLISMVLPGLILAGLGVGLVKSCSDNYYSSKPGVVYLVNGKKVIERRFDTNEQFQEYLNSERGKREAEYYTRLNQTNTTHN